MRVFATIATSGRGRRGRRGRRGIKIRSFVGRLVFVRSFPADDRWMSRDLIDFDFDFDSRRPSGVGDRWRRR